MDRRFSSVESIPCPALVHRDGVAAWGNKAFAERFGIRPMPNKHLKLRELLWSLGVGDPLAGMIAEGAAFDDCLAPGPTAQIPALHLRQTMYSDRDQAAWHLLWIAETADSMAELPANG